MGKKLKINLTSLEMISLTIIFILVGALFFPRFCSLSEELKIATEKQDASRIRIAISNYYLDSMLKNRTPFCPETLDSAHAGCASPDNRLFVNVLADKAITSGGWCKLTSTTYECYNKKYTYNPATCDFNQ